MGSYSYITFTAEVNSEAQSKERFAQWANYWKNQLSNDNSDWDMNEEKGTMYLAFESKYGYEGSEVVNVRDSAERAHLRWTVVDDGSSGEWPQEEIAWRPGMESHGRRLLADSVPAITRSDLKTALQSRSLEEAMSRIIMYLESDDPRLWTLE